MKQLLITSIASLALLGAAHAAGDATAGKTKSAMCAACHGTDGNSPVPNFPKLAGQHPDYIIKQLKEFKGGERTDATMNGMAAALSEQDMADIAAFYATQTGTVGSPCTDGVSIPKSTHCPGRANSIRETVV